MSVSQAGGNWVVSGKKNSVTINASDFTMKVDAGPVTWRMSRSLQDDMLVKSRGEECYVRLADAGKIKIERYDTGFKTGVKISLSRFRHNGLRQKGTPPVVRRHLTLPEGRGLHRGPPRRLWSRGIAGWIAAPLPILFHRPFLAGVIWPLIGIPAG